MSAAPEPLAYPLPEFAKAVGLSLSSVKNLIADGSLVPSYARSKPLISRAEAERWLASLPVEKKTSHDAG